MPSTSSPSAIPRVHVHGYAVCGQCKHEQQLDDCKCKEWYAARSYQLFRGREDVAIAGLENEVGIVTWYGFQFILEVPGTVQADPAVILWG